MSLRQEMLQAARSSRILLRDAGRVERFLRGRMNSDGGFADRSGKSDLYYTVFGLEALLALGAGVQRPAVESYLRGFGAGESLDLVHLSCLARCWADLDSCRPQACLPAGGRQASSSLGAPGESSSAPLPMRQEILRRVETFGSADGGYNQVASSRCGTAYGCFLAFGAYEDLEGRMPDAGGLVRCLESLKVGDGAYVNAPGLPIGSTPTTAAAVALLRRLGRGVDPASVRWLLARCCEGGGFLAVPGAPTADLLSTATALHALVGAGTPLGGIRRPCLDFVNALWCETGGFRGNLFDETPDCEYTWYGLLALGNLAGP